MILLIDNYDSFSYNLVQLAGSVNPHISVIRNDEITAAGIEALLPSHLILSPGSGHPRDAGVCEDAVRRLAAKVPILGVCLGHQAICTACGAEITHAGQLMHGKKRAITIDNTCLLFRGLPRRIEAARYHSLAVRKETLPARLQVIAEDGMGEVMAVKYEKHQVYGVQFHPESIMTPLGRVILENFLKIGR